MEAWSFLSADAVFIVALTTLENHYWFTSESFLSEKSFVQFWNIYVEKQKTSCLKKIPFRKHHTVWLILKDLQASILSLKLQRSWSVWNFLMLLIAMKIWEVRTEVGTVLFCEVIKMKNLTDLLGFHSEIVAPNHCINEVAGQPGGWWILWPASGQQDCFFFGVMQKWEWV